MNGPKELDDIRAALKGDETSIRIVRSFRMTTGEALTGARVMVKSRRIGPVIYPAADQTLGDVLKMLGDMAVES